MSSVRSVGTVVVGGGHAGLLMSAVLSDAGREHVVLERRPTLGGGWQDRWDAFRLVTPNWTVGMPGLDYEGDEPDGFMTRDELVAHFRRYAGVISAPVELETDVVRLVTRDAGAERFELITSRGGTAGAGTGAGTGSIRARNVVVAGGPFQTPYIGALGAVLDPSIRQLHSHDYRKPDDLPPGRVLLVGSGQTGVQLAEELQEAGREVLISVGHCGPAPRRYRGRDIFWWLRQLGTRGPELGVALPNVASLPSPAARFACNPQLTGHAGGHDVNLRRMAAEGVRLVGRLESLDGTTARFRADLGENLRFADSFFGLRIRGLCDTFAERSGEDFPPGEVEELDYEPPEVTELDLRAEGVSTVLWTSGYRPAFDWIDVPVLDDFGLPRQVGGVSDVDGLSFIGLPWMVDMGSANFVGLVRDAQALAARV